MNHIGFLLFIAFSVTNIIAQDPQQHRLQPGSRFARIAKGIYGIATDPRCWVPALLMSARTVEAHHHNTACIKNLECGPLQQLPNGEFQSQCLVQDIACLQYFEQPVTVMVYLQEQHQPNQQRVLNPDCLTKIRCNSPETTSTGDFFADCMATHPECNGALGLPKHVIASLIEYPDNWQRWHPPYTSQDCYTPSLGLCLERNQLKANAWFKAIARSVEKLSDEEFWGLAPYEPMPNIPKKIRSAHYTCRDYIKHYDRNAWFELPSETFYQIASCSSQNPTIQLRVAIEFFFTRFALNRAQMLKSKEVRDLVIDAITHQPKGTCDDKRLNYHPSVDLRQWFSKGTYTHHSNPVMERLRYVLQEIKYQNVLQDIQNQK